MIQDPALVAAAWELPVAALYKKSGFEHQKARALCGPTSTANALRSFGDAIDRATLLNGTDVTTLFGFRLGGMTLDQLAHVVARKSARKATLLRDLTVDELREHLRRSNEPGRRYIANFHRAPLFGWGGGHHSPLAGYLEERDLAFILDVNRGVGPFLVSSERLHAAIATGDRASGRTRGLLLVE